MCSISGFLASAPLSPATLAKLCDSLIFHGSQRGRQSTGICVYPTMDTPQLLKKAVAPSAFIGLDEYQRLVATPLTAALIHTRQPTCGGLGDEQAQPFLITTDDAQVATTHNGYYRDFDSIKNAHSITKPSGVDSELAATYIAAHGPSTLPLFIESTDGPSSIAAVHNSELYFIRSGNPLSYAFVSLTNQTKVLVWASTETILRAALAYTWLFDSLPMFHTTAEGHLYKASPTTLTKLTTSTVSYSRRVSYTPSSRGINNQTCPTNNLHICPYHGYVEASFFTTTCRCIRTLAGDKWAYTPNPNLPAPPPPAPPTPTPAPSPAPDSDAMDAADPDDDDSDPDLRDTPFNDPTLERRTGFWLSDAILDLPTDRALAMTLYIGAACTSPTSMSDEDWAELGKLLIECVEVADAD